MSIEERFHDRIILGEKEQKNLLRYFLGIYNGNFNRAALRIAEISGKSISISALYAYLNYQNKSLAKFAFEVMIGELMSDVNFRERTLKDIRADSLLNEWRENRQTMLNVAREASKKGVEATGIKYGKDWPYKRMAEVREFLRRKYGPHCYRIIGGKSTLASRKKYGDRWSKILSEATREGFKRKYGDDWEEVIGKRMTKNLEKKFGQDWAKKFVRMGWERLVELYGEDEALKMFEAARMGKKTKTMSERCEKYRVNYLITRQLAKKLYYSGNLSSISSGLPQKEVLRYMRFIRVFFPEICGAMGLELKYKRPRLAHNEEDGIYALRVEKKS